MKLLTAALFQLLLRCLKPQVVCDIGSKDGYHALRFRQLLPHARIIAFEANPHNAAYLQTAKQVSDARIEVHHKAVCNTNEMIIFNVEAVSPEEPARKGISSTRKRVKDSLGVTEVQVEAIRLDDYFNPWPRLPESVALWIDVEGGAYEVLEGIRSIRDRVHLLHVEVETDEIWQNQRLKPDVQALMSEMGFVEVARGLYELQHDLVFVNKQTFDNSYKKIRRRMLLTLSLTYVWRAHRKASRVLSRTYLTILGLLDRRHRAG